MSMSLKFKELRKLRLNQWLISSLILIPVIGMGYLAYNQFVIVPQQQAKLKVQIAPVERGNLALMVSAHGMVQPKQLAIPLRLTLATLD